jgi:hypothetical protein
MRELISKELQRDEKLLWTGRPAQGVMFKANDLFMVPFSFMWGGFAVFWEYSVFTSDAPIFFRLWGIPFVAIGLYMIFGRFFFEAKKRAETIYGLTDKRAIIISGLFSKKTTSINLKNIPEVQVTQKPDGSGTIILGANSPMQFFQGSGWPGSYSAPPSFEGIKDVQLVKSYIHQYQNT